MSELYKIVRSRPYYINEELEKASGLEIDPVLGAKRYHGFEKAKKAMRETVKEKLADMDQHCAELIDSYCAEYYPDGAPQNFAMLKELIREAIHHPEELEKNIKEKYSDIDFEDDRINFGIAFDKEGAIPTIYMNASEEAMWKFPEGRINVKLCELDDPFSSLWFWLTAGKRYGLEILLSLLTDEDEEDLLFEN